jgi:hypothetical protein
MEVLTLIILGLSGLLFTLTVGVLVVMLKEFARMKTAAILMEAAFKEHQKMTEGVQRFVSHGLEAAEEQYANVQDDYIKMVNSNNALQERINQLEASRKKPLAPDVTFN